MNSDKPRENEANPFDQIKELIANGDTEKALNELHQYIQRRYGGSRMESELILLKGKFSNYRQRKRLNLSKDENVVTEINFSLLEIMAELQNESFDRSLIADKYQPRDPRTTEKLNSFFQENKMPIVASGTVVVIVLGFNSLTFGIVAGIALLALSFMWDELFG